MARARNIKPGFFKNEDLVELPFEYRLLFIGLWTLADKEGRLEDRPKRIKMEIFPADNVDVDAGMRDLEKLEMIKRYDVNGEKYIVIVNFTKHQSPHHTEKNSEIPDVNGVITVNAQKRFGENPPDSLIPDSLIPDSSVVVAENPPKKKNKTQFSGLFVPNENHYKSAAEKGLLLSVEFDKFKNHHVANGSLFASWDAAFSKWLVNAVEFKARASPSRPEKFDPVAFVNQGRKQPGGGNDEFINGTAERVA